MTRKCRAKGEHGCVCVSVGCVREDVCVCESGNLCVCVCECACRAQTENLLVHR